MKVAPYPENEVERLERLRQYAILDTPPEDAFDRITRIVAKTIGVPIALVSLVDRDRQWFKSTYGLAAAESSRDIAFCSHAILNDELFVVEDASKDSRFLDNPFVTSDPSIRFYAGAPLQTPDGMNLGTLCAIDSQPRNLSPDHRQLLTDLARLVVDEMELRIAIKDAMKKVAKETKIRAIKDEFLSTVTHELRTPLTSIRATLGLLQGGVVGQLPDQASEMLSIAERNSVNLISLINDLLDLQKFESGKMSFDFRTFDPQELAQETCDNMAAYAAESNVHLSLDVSANPSIIGDPDRIQQALTNLISNAIKFSPADGIVNAQVSSNNNSLCFSITDKGPGIPEDYQPHVFEKFTQSTCPNQPKGTGLGLAITKAIAEAHNGSVTFTTQAGCGTTFYLDIPLRQTLVGSMAIA